LNIAVSAGQTKALVVTGDFNVASNVTGGQHSFQLMSASSVIAGGVVSGSFPVAGNVFTVGTTAAGTLTVVNGTDPSDPNTGTTQAEIGNFKLEAGTNDIEVRRVTLVQAGTVSNSDVKNINLYQGATLVATAAGIIGDKIVLNFNPAVTLTNGTIRTFTLKADISGRSNRTIKTYIEYTTDVYAVDKLYNAGASVDVTGFDGTGAPANDFAEVNIQGGALTIAANGPATANVAKGIQAVQFFNFSITSGDSAVEIRNIEFKIGATNGGKLYDGSVDFFRNFRVKNITTGATLMGPTSLSLSGNSATQTLSLSDSFNIPAGTTMKLAITADLANSMDLDFIEKTYVVTLGNTNIFGASDVRVTDTGEYLDISKIIPNTEILGNPMTVKASSLTVAQAATPSASIAVKKQQMIASSGIVLTAGAQSDVTVRSVKLSGLGDENNQLSYTAPEFAQVVTACDLYDGETKLGTTQSLDSAGGTIQISNVNLLIAKGTSKTLVAKCTADSAVVHANGDFFKVGINSVNDIVAEDADNNTITIAAVPGVAAAPAQNVKNGGVVTIAADNLRQSTILVADGTTWNNIASYKATAQYEAVTIDRIRVVGTGESASFSSIAVLQNGATVGEDVLPAGINQSKDLVLSTPITVPKDGSVTFQIAAKAAPVQGYASVPGTGIARSGATIAAGIEFNEQLNEWDPSYMNQLNVRLIGQASGDRLYTAALADINGNTFVVRKTKPTATRQALSTTTLANTTQDLYKLQVSADAAGSVAVKKVTFDVALSGAGLSLSNFRLRKGSSDIALADMVITDGAAADLEAGSLVATGKVVVAFTSEETIIGAGSVYTLYASVAGADAGESVSVTPSRDGALTTYSGYLDNDLVGGFAGPSLDTDAIADGVGNQFGHFIWSDNSEVPHFYDVQGVGTNFSRDWTNDVFVEDLTQTQTLTR
jgi:hypothetical protein